MLTGKTRIDARPASPSDIMAFHGQLPAKTVRAWTLWWNEELVGVGGYMLGPAGAHVFSDIRGEVPKMTIWRAALALMDMVPSPATCWSDNDELMTRLGWEHIEGDLYRWQH